MTGTFDYDADAGTYSNVDLHLIGLPWTFNTVIASAQYTNASNLEVVVPPVESSAPQLQFEFYSPLTDAGGTVAVAVSRFSYCPSSNCSTLGSAADVGTTGTVSEVTPEPATLALSGTAGLAFVLTRLRKRKA